MNPDQHKNATTAKKIVSPISRIVIRLFLLSFASICLTLNSCIVVPKPIKKTTSNVRYVSMPFHDTAKNQS
jgi:starvation-inducible outer membrane lipoprotein